MQTKLYNFNNVTKITLIRLYFAIIFYILHILEKLDYNSRRQGIIKTAQKVTLKINCHAAAD